MTFKEVIGKIATEVEKSTKSYIGHSITQSSIARMTSEINELVKPLYYIASPDENGVVKFTLNIMPSKIRQKINELAALWQVRRDLSPLSDEEVLDLIHRAIKQERTASYPPLELPEDTQKSYFPTDAWKRDYYIPKPTASPEPITSPFGPSDGTTGQPIWMIDLGIPVTYGAYPEDSNKL